MRGKCWWKGYIKRHGKEAKKEEIAAAKVHTTIFNATTTRVNCSSSQRPHIAIVQTDWSLREEVEATIANPKLTREICRSRRLHINKLILIIKYKGSDYFYRVYCTQLITRVWKLINSIDASDARFSWWQ